MAPLPISKVEKIAKLWLRWLAFRFVEPTVTKAWRKCYWMTVYLFATGDFWRDSTCFQVVTGTITRADGSRRIKMNFQPRSPWRMLFVPLFVFEILILIVWWKLNNGLEEVQQKRLDPRVLSDLSTPVTWFIELAISFVGHGLIVLFFVAFVCYLYIFFFTCCGFSRWIVAGKRPNHSTCT